MCVILSLLLDVSGRELVWEPMVVILTPLQAETGTVDSRSVRNKNFLIRDLIVDEEKVLACISETWVRGETDIQEVRRSCFSVQHQPRLKG